LQEWKSALRSAIHPAIFATIYYLADLVAQVLRLTPALRAELFLAAPKTLQGAFAALGDYYTWQLARRVFGHDSHQAWAALVVTVLSPWQWFCSTRTLSNCLETTLTIAALYNWPWQWSLTDRDNARYDHAGLRVREDGAEDAVDETTRLRRSLLLAALATILRPTNLLIWITLAAMTSLQMSSGGWFARIPWLNQRILIEFNSPAFLRATLRERRTLLVESVLCGSTVLVLSVLVDRFYYQSWTFPPLKFIYFNIIQSLSVFYGRNDWHYYLSQGFPLLLTTALPFAMVGLYRGIFLANSIETTLTAITLSQFATIACAVPAALSLISHKEVRFIYPLLSLLHILAAEPLVQFFGASLIHPLQSRRSPPYALVKRLILALFVLVNVSIAIYTTTIHGRGVIDVLAYLRHQDEGYYLAAHHNLDSRSISKPNLTAAFLMPCHSTPWRSHLIYPTISAWALTCEPPLHLSSTEKESYVDEADAFYSDPSLWLRRNMSRQPPSSARGGIFTSRDKQQRHGSGERGQPIHNIEGRRSWPDYLIFFAAAERTMETALRGSGYVECWRGFNSHWHDDRRRSGDVVAWCLFPERRLTLPGKGRGEGSRAPGMPGSLEREYRDSTLGGAKGPWGVGVGTGGGKSKNSHERKDSTTTTTTTTTTGWRWRWRWWGSGQESEKQPKMKPKPKAKTKTKAKAKKKQGVWS
jgi:GPI mannosyltransferase 3